MLVEPSITDLLEKVDSRYTLVIETAKRARQIVEGDEPMVECESKNPVTIAAFEVVEEGINIGGKKSKNSWSLDPGTFDYNSSIRFENNENKYIGIYNHYTSYPMDEDQSYLSLTGYGSSIRLGQSCQINGVTWLQDKCFIDGDLVLNGTDLVIHMGSGTYVTLTAEKLAKIIKFIDSIEEVTE